MDANILKVLTKTADSIGLRAMILWLIAKEHTSSNKADKAEGGGKTAPIMSHYETFFKEVIK